MKKYFSKEVIIGITVIISLLLLFWGIKFLKGINLFTPSNFYYVEYEQVDGLTVSAPVTINGFQVGLVREINYLYDDNGKLQVQLSLDKQLKIPQGSTAVISTDILGTSQIELKLAHGSSSYYNVGDYIPSSTKKGVMDNVKDDLLPSVAQMMPKIDSILTNINMVLSNPALNSAITRLDNITANLEQSSVQLNRMMGNSVPGILNNANTVSRDLVKISGDLCQVSTELKKLPLDSTMRNVNGTMANLKVITDKANGKDSSLGLLLNDTRLYNHADQTVVSLDSLLLDLRKNPKRYVTFKIF